MQFQQFQVNNNKKTILLSPAKWRDNCFGDRVYTYVCMSVRNTITFESFRQDKEEGL